MLDAGFGQLSCVFRCNIEPDLVHVDKRVVDAPEGDVCSGPADLEVEALNERRDHFQRDADAAPVLAGGTGRNESRRGIQQGRGFRPLHGRHSELEKRSDHADGVTAGHRVRLVCLQHDETGVGFGACWRQEQVVYPAA